MVAWLKNNALTIIVVVVATVFLTRLFTSEPEQQTVQQSDDAKIKQAQDERDKAISERDTWAFKFKDLLGTRKPSEPVSIITGRIERPLSFEFIEDTVKKTRTLLPTMDLILYGRVENDRVEFYTANLMTEYMGGEGRRIYSWERESNDFYFAVKDKGGVTMTFSRDFLKWGGVYAGLGSDFQKPYLLLSARAWVLEYVEFECELNSRPGLQVEAKVRL